DRAARGACRAVARLAPAARPAPCVARRSARRARGAAVARLDVQARLRLLAPRERRVELVRVATAHPRLAGAADGNRSAAARFAGVARTRPRRGRVRRRARPLRLRRVHVAPPGDVAPLRGLSRLSVPDGDLTEDVPDHRPALRLSADARLRAAPRAVGAT